MVRRWRAEALREGKELDLPRMPFMLRNIWTAAILWFAILMGLSTMVRTVAQATVIIAALGICWAVAMWVPFAIIMEVSDALLCWLKLSNGIAVPKSSRSAWRGGYRRCRAGVLTPSLAAHS